MTNPLRVAMIIQRYSPHIGGAEKQLAAIAPRLQQRGVEVHIFTRRYSGLKAFEIINDIPVHRLPIPGNKIIASLSFTFSGMVEIGKLRPDVIHAHELLSPTTTAVFAKQVFGIPVVAKILRGGSRGDLAALRRDPISAKRIPMLLGKVDKFITISQEIDRELDGIGVTPDRRVYIPNGVDLECFTPLPDEEKKALRQSLGAPAGPVVLFTGRLSPEKNLRRLVEMWPAIRQIHPTAELWIVGTGEEESILQQMRSDGVQILGPQKDVLPYLQAADIFVLPSNTEGLSNALLEACSCALPAVATTIGGTVDIIQDKQTGLLVPPDNSETLQDALLSLLADPEKCIQFGLKARQFVTENYAISTTVDRLMTLYQSLRKNREGSGYHA